MYNIGGGRENSISMLEAISKFENLTGKKLNYGYDETNRVGDHICYISDLSRIKADYPKWEIRHDIDTVFKELVG